MTKQAGQVRARDLAHQRACAPRGRARRGVAPTPAQPGSAGRHQPAAGSSRASQVPVAEQARRSRIEQGLPPTIQDRATLAYIARLVLPTIGKPRRAR